MPIYEFHCPECAKDFEVLCSLRTDLTTLACEHCGGRKIQKKISAVAQGSGTKSLDLGGHDHSHGSGGGSCGSCSTHSCGSCGH